MKELYKRWREAIGYTDTIATAKNEMTLEEIAAELENELVALLNPYKGMANTEVVRKHAETQANSFLHHQINIGRIKHKASVRYRFELIGGGNEITVRLVEKHCSSSHLPQMRRESIYVA